ncbi:MAG: hypothetical protein NZ954_02840 [Thermofilaceae archaeon]|nr:hypothetical protein [Thermofilaceae archaeon]MDW8004475.1 hypothetical protein [Thermofilaceae archaeon]
MLGSDPELLRTRLEELKIQLRTLEKEAEELRNNRDSLNSEVKEISTKLRQLVMEYKELKDEYLKLKNQKEEIYNNMQKLKNSKNQLREDLNALSSEVKTLLNEMKNFQEILGRRKVNVFELRERLERLEWEYQTRTFSAEEEKSFVERIRDTESLLRAAERYNECVNQVKGIRQLISEKRKKITELNTQIKELSEQYMQIKSKFKEIREKLNNLRTNITELIDKKEALRRKADEYHGKLINKTIEIKQVREDVEKTALLLKAAEMSQTLTRRRAEMYELALKALEKYKQGEKLSLDEFKLLMEFSLIEHGAASSSS